MCPPKANVAQCSTDSTSTINHVNSSNAASTTQKRSERIYTRSEVEAHSSKEDCWIIIDNVVYDVTKFLATEIHPGGDVIFTYAGKDATDVFYAYHHDYVFKKKLPKYVVGKLDKPIELTQMEKEYRAMHEQIKADGLYETRPEYWLFKLFYPVALVVLGTYLLGWSNSTSVWTYVLAGALIGVGQHQAAFIGHDACHVSVTGLYGPDFILSLIYGTYIFGVSSIWWKYTHNQHHVVTNEYDIDPDVTHLPFYAVNKYMFLSKKKAKHMGPVELRVTRLIVGLQWLTFVPIMVFIARISMIINNFLMLFILNKVPTMPWQKLHLQASWVWGERLAIIGHFASYYYIFGVLTPPEYRLIALIVQHFTVGALHIQLTLSHWERPTKHSSEETDNWFVKQVVTGRNIEGDITNEWIYGGLHFQIEHHIYPRLPRHNLRKCRDKYVRPFCEKYGIEYCSSGFWSAVYDVFKHLAEVSSHAYDERVE